LRRILNEKEYTPDRKSKSLYFDTKHYTFSKENIVNWAKANNRVIEIPLEDFINLLDYNASQQLINKLGDFINMGGEAIAFKNENQVNKIIFSLGFRKGPWTIAKEKMVKHNRVFPETAYKVAYVIHCPWEKERDKILNGSNKRLKAHLEELEYDTERSSEEYWPVLCQDTLDTDNIFNKFDAKTINKKDKNTGKDYMENPIDRFLSDKGFQQLNHSFDHEQRVYKKGRTYVSDIGIRNIGLDKEGNFKIFDAILSTDPEDFSVNMDNGEVFR
jgi:hypothetical protein